MTFSARTDGTPGGASDAVSIAASRADPVRYEAAAPPAASLTADALDGDTLAVLTFGETSAAGDPRVCDVPLSPAAASPRLREVWRANGPVESGYIDGIGYACDGHVLFLQARVAEPEIARDLAGASEATYSALLAACDAIGLPWPFRVWNYLADINGLDPVSGRERYQVFCDGRKRALLGAGRAFEHALPAASAIGCPPGGGLLIYALSAVKPGLQIENPRQVSAFRYPRRYGPSSPSFSRSMLQRWGDGSRHLYVSGTASIVGHASLHDAACDAQLDETLDNLDALLGHAAALTGERHAFTSLKVYLRDPAAAARAATRIAARIGCDLPVLLLQGDICRRELLLEMEGIAAPVR